MRLMMIAAGAALIATSAAADPWKDESGKSREYYGNYYNGYGGQYGYIPKGHRPPPGECRVWIPGLPAGHQPPPTSCGYAFAQAKYYGGYVVHSKRKWDRKRGYLRL